MGLFTTIIDDQNRQWQIKCGWDNCETYRLGEEITDWHIIKEHPGEGYLLDGVYETNSYNNDNINVLIGIKNHVVMEIVKLPNDPDPDADNYDEEYERVYSDFNKKYSFAPPREWWSEDLWQKKDSRDKERKEENDRFIKNLDAMNLTPKERMAMIMVAPIKRALVSEGFFRRMLQIEPISAMDIKNNAS